MKITGTITGKWNELDRGVQLEMNVGLRDLFAAAAFCADLIVNNAHASTYPATALQRSYEIADAALQGGTEAQNSRADTLAFALSFPNAERTNEDQG